jgi:branched-chain amino acid transport system ATP-binding protein
MTELLAARGLCKRFGGIHALRDVTVVQHTGETLGMIGPNGSGKTSFVNAVTGHLALNQGHIRFGGTDITKAGPHKVTHAGLTRTYQAVRVFGRLSVRDNLATAGLLHQRAASLQDDETAEMLAWLQLDGSQDRLAGSLTLFEQRRLELAMRLMLRPQLVMLDEPVGGLAASEVRSSTP